MVGSYLFYLVVFEFVLRLDKFRTAIAVEHWHRGILDYPIEDTTLVDAGGNVNVDGNAADLHG